MQLSAIPISAIPLPLLLIDAEGFLHGAKLQAQDCLGLSERSLENQHLSRIFSPDPEVRRLIKKIAETGEEVSDHCLSLRSTGMPFSLHAGQATDGIVVVLIPEGVREEVNIQLRQKEMAETVARIALEMAHEIKNPLTALRGATQWLSEHSDSGESIEATRVMLLEVDRIRERIDDLLQLGPRAETEIQLVNIHSILDDVCRPIGGVRLRRVYDPSLPEIMANPTRLRQAIENLWINALEAGSHHIEWSTRVVSTTQLPMYVGAAIEARIISDGANIPDHLREHIFEPFITGKQRGSGLGLAIVQRVMHEHEGRVLLRAEQGRTAFILQLPLRDKV